jgi:hypothetical protein
MSPWLSLRNRDPNRHYVLASEFGTEFGPEFYEGLGPEGYIIEVATPDGPRFGAGKTSKMGEPIRYRGQHILVSCTKANHDHIVKYGDGVSIGQTGYDGIMKAIGRSKPTADITDSMLRPGSEASVQVGATRERISDLESM